MSRIPGNKKLVGEVLGLYGNLIIPFMKVRRDIYFPTEPDRLETDGEHAYTLSVIAITLCERMKLDLDTGLIAKYALVHDLVEAHAGDVSARADDAALAQKAKREHEAFLLIKERHVEHAPWIAEHIEMYEKRTNDEARFVYATDKLMGAFSWLAGDGTNWASNYPDKDGKDYRKVVERLRKKASVYPPLLDLFDEVHHILDQKRPAYYEKSKGMKYKQP